MARTPFLLAALIACFACAAPVKQGSRTASKPTEKPAKADCFPASDSLGNPGTVSEACLEEMNKRLRKLSIMLRDFDISGLTLGDLYRLKGVESRIREIEIDSRDLPELHYRLDEMELEEKLQAKTGRNEVYVKDLEDLGFGHALVFIPLSSEHIEFMQLTAEQLEEMGAKAKYPADQPPHLH